MMENNKKRKVADIDKSVDTIYSTTNTSDSKGQSYNTATTTPGNNNASNNSSIFNTPGSSNITRYNLLRDYFSRHPCLKPYEEEDGVGLAFNYWQDSYYLVDEHILEVIDFLTTPTVSGTKSSDPQSFSAAANVKSQNGIDFLRKDSLKSIEDGCDNVLIVGIHSVDPLDLAESINTMPFLSSCSSMPIRHLKKESLRFSSNSNLYQWPYMDMQTINSTLLWQDKKTLTLSQIPKTALHEFFSNYIIIYKVQSIISNLMIWFCIKCP